MVDLPALPNPNATTNTYKIFAYYRDSNGNDGAMAEAPLTVRNFRAPVRLDTGTGLIGTSDPGPSPEVEAGLKWPSKSGQYRVHLADQMGMGIAPGELAEEGPVPSRGLVAKVGATKTGDRMWFRMLTDPPVSATGAETLFTATLPRSLETVQFLRVVPLGSDGDEFDFNACGILAVPESRRPVPPLLDASIDAATGVATLVVSTDGLGETVARRDEPGLFDPTKLGKEPPRAIIHRAVAGVADPIYAKRIGDPVPMLRDAATGRDAATIADDNGGNGLEPYVKYVYWAGWQMPPERRLPAKTTEVHVGDMEAVDPSSTRDRPRPFSPPSAPRTVMRIPAAVPGPPVPDDVAVTLAAGPTADTATVTARLADPPQVHKLGQGSYRLAFWTQWQGKPIEAIKNATAPTSAHPGPTSRPAR